MRQQKALEKQFFDNFVLTKTDYDVFDENGYTTLIEEFCTWLKPRAGELLLDLGGGTGAFSRRLSRFELNVCVIDFSIKCLEIAAKMNRDCSQLAGDIEQLPIKDSSVDILSYSAVLHHFPNFNYTLKEGHRILKPGGRLFAFDPHIKNPFMWLYRSPKSPFYSKKGQTANERLLSVNEIKQGLKQAGFQDSFVKPVSGITFKYVESHLVRRLLALYNFQERLFKGRHIALKYGSFVLTFARKQ
jgi:SAM-dependent methyltransferase